MKDVRCYQKRLGFSSSEEVFEYLINSFKETIKGWDYFVDWGKIMARVDDIEIILNIMNYLVGKDNIEKEFKHLLKKYPEIVEVIPILIACRDKEFTVLESSENIFNFKKFSFKKKKTLSEEDINKVTEFVIKTGLIEMFQRKRIKNIVDYVIGIEVGLDSNARKNRSGSSMETLTEIFINKICKENESYRYIKQATANKIRNELGYIVSVDKSNRIFDFAIDNTSKLYLIETNYYGGGGSKLKSTAGEYRALYDFIKNSGDHRFIWITDGKGWLTAKNPLQETFNYVDYVLNLDMLEKGLLEDIITNGD